MARSLNKVTIIGVIGRDVEVRSMQNGSQAATLSLATDESYNDKNTGQKVEQTEWHRVTAFGKLAEIMGQYLQKGAKVYIEGKLRTREWEKDGVKRYTTEIVANEMIMLSSNPNAQNGQRGGNYQQAPQQGYQQAPQQGYQQGYQQAPQQGYQQQQQQAAQHQNSFNSFEDDIPF